MAYIDLIVLVILIIFVGIYSKRFSTYFFGFGMIDVLFRILNVINGYIPSNQIRVLINTYVPSSIPYVISKYTNGTLELGLTCLYVIIISIFLFYVVKVFIKRKKI